MDDRRRRQRSEYDTDVLPPIRTGSTRAADDDEAQRIDATLTRMTAAHAGVRLAEDPGREPVQARRRRPRPVQLVVAAVALVLFAVVAFQYVAKARLDDAVRAVEALDPGSGAIVDAAGQAGAENVLFVVSDGQADGPRVDTVLVAHVPPGGGDVVGLSVPRDLEVSRPPCRRFDAATGSYGDEVVPAQANAPLLSALDLGGPQCAVRVVQQLTGLAVTRYVGLDLAGVGPLVEALRGVDVCVDRPVNDALLGPIVPVAGPVTLDGRQARDLAAARAVDGDTGGDRDVLEREARLLAAAVDEVLSAGVLLDLGRAATIRAALGGALTVDGADLDRVLATAGALRSFAADGVTFTVVPTDAGPSGQGGARLREAEAADLFAALRAGEAVPEQTVLAAAGAPQPGEVSVEVLNASGRAGRAGEIGETLGGLGFDVSGVGNAEPGDATEIRFSPDRAAAARVLATAVPAAIRSADPGGSGVLQLVIGRGFDGVVRAPTSTPAGPPAAPAARCS